MRPVVDDASRGLERLGDDRLEHDRFLAQLDLAVRQAGDVQQAVEQMRQVFDLPLDDLPRLLDGGIALGHAPDRLHGDPDRHEGIAQLVAEHRQELVLGAILRLGRGASRLVLAHDLRLLFAKPARGEIRGDLAGADRQESQMVVRVGVGLRVADEEHALHPVERDEGNRQVRGAGHEVGDIRRQPVRRRRWPRP